ncbi:hypothetical protein SAY86_027830 [Trapa natans]|uniref:Protein kinase domain-containing protein n=1 Tax=Trapa natans TaxID=22666 RepID=A0AAN7LZR1_TRANT|nr:hypothetical protein SAY86_027830 [Trapa natans]
MNRIHLLLIIALPASIAALSVILALTFFSLCKRASGRTRDDVETSKRNSEGSRRGKEEIEENADAEAEDEDLITFHGGEGLTICDILEAPGEVIGKSMNGTLYRAELQRVNSVMLLRFLRPACTASDGSVNAVVQALGRVRHPNLVPILGFYAGPRGEKLLIHPFYRFGNLAEFIRDGGGETLNWSTVYNISICITKALDHLHMGLPRPIIHGNLKSKNVLLDRHQRPYISDFGLLSLLNGASGQHMLEASSAQGYKAPELIKVRDANERSDVYSLGVIFLELLTGKEPVNENAAPDEEPYLPNYMREAVHELGISNLCLPNLLLQKKPDGDGSSIVTEECILKFFQLAMACCSSSPSLRPNTRRVLKKLENIVKG